MWVLIDNYDSFTHILHHYLLQTGHDCRVYRNDELTMEDLVALQPERLILSPGPQTPLQAGITLPALAHFAPLVPVLGICLGHQAIGMHFGARLVHAAVPRHGKTSCIRHTGTALFTGLPAAMTVMRYHSLAIQGLEDTGLSVLASDEDGTIMAVRHRALPCTGVQFHPESVGTAQGAALIRNWVAYP